MRSQSLRSELIEKRIRQKPGSAGLLFFPDPIASLPGNNTACHFCRVSKYTRCSFSRVQCTAHLRDAQAQRPAKFDGTRLF
jgi:hypothetical protein